MFQAIKRAKFISKYNQPYSLTADLANIHAWLQKNGWPANEMVDAFMSHANSIKQHSWGQSSTVASTFWYFMDLQFRFLHDGDSSAIETFYKEFIACNDFGPHVSPDARAYVESLRSAQK